MSAKGKKGSQGIQANDILPQAVENEYRRLFTQYLPGWQLTGEYNYSASPSTQMAAVQLKMPLHSGSHPWINDTLIKLLKTFEKDVKPELRTLRLAQLVNFLTEAQNLDNFDKAGKTGGYVAFTSRMDPYLIDKMGYHENTDHLRGYNKTHLDWNKIAATPAGKEIEALKPQLVNGKLRYDGTLNNGSFFSKAWDKIDTFKTYSGSAEFSHKWATTNSADVSFDGGAVRWMFDAVLASNDTDTRCARKTAQAPVNDNAFECWEEAA